MYIFRRFITYFNFYRLFSSYRLSKMPVLKVTSQNSTTSFKRKVASSPVSNIWNLVLFLHLKKEIQHKI